MVNQLLVGGRAAFSVEVGGGGVVFSGFVAFFGSGVEFVLFLWAGVFKRRDVRGTIAG